MDNKLVNEIEALAIEATPTAYNNMTTARLAGCYDALQEIRDLISEYKDSQHTSGISEAGQQVLDTIQLCNALNRESQR